MNDTIRNFSPNKLCDFSHSSSNFSPPSSNSIESLNTLLSSTSSPSSFETSSAVSQNDSDYEILEHLIQDLELSSGNPGEFFTKHFSSEDSETDQMVVLDSPFGSLENILNYDSDTQSAENLSPSITELQTSVLPMGELNVNLNSKKVVSTAESLSPVLFGKRQRPGSPASGDLERQLDSNVKTLRKLKQLTRRSFSESDSSELDQEGDLKQEEKYEPNWVLKSLEKYDEEYVKPAISNCIKEELRYKIESGLLRTGKKHLKTDFEEPKGYKEMSLEEIRKINETKRKNRLHAMNSRLKLRAEREFEQMKFNHLVAENYTLSVDMSRLRKRIRELKDALEMIEHSEKCKLATKHRKKHSSKHRYTDD